MKIPPKNTNNIAQFGFRSKTMNIYGRAILKKQEVIWAATSLSNRIHASLDGKRLRLFEYDYRGEPVISDAKKRTLRLLNPEIEELILPENFLCPWAYDWLKNIGDRLVLIIKDFDPKCPQLKSNIMRLNVGVDLQEGKTYGILLLNS